MSAKGVPERLAALREEYEKGQQMLADLERESNEVRDGLLRIAGAIQVLEEMEAEQSGADTAGT